MVFVAPLTSQDGAPAVERGPKFKLLNCQTHVTTFRSMMSPSGESAVIFEGVTEDTDRLGLWDLKQGRLIRFLSAEKDKVTTEFKGKDDADFGAKIVQRGSQAFTFSTDGKLAAASIQKIVKIWELATGKLLHEVEGSSYHPSTFRFVDERRIVGKAGAVIEIIDAGTGEKRKLMGPVNYESYGGAVRGDLFTLVSPFDVFTLSLKTGERTRLAGLSPTSEMAASRTWYSKDGTKLYIQRDALVQVLDVAKREYTNIYQVVAPREGNRIKALAADANLLAITYPDRIELWDGSLGEVRTKVIPVDKHGNIGGISSDGSKLILARDGRGAVLLDFGGRPPAEEINVAKLIADQAPVSSR